MLQCYIAAMLIMYKSNFLAYVKSLRGWSLMCTNSRFEYVVCRCAGIFESLYLVQVFRRLLCLVTLTCVPRFEKLVVSET